MLPPPTTVAVVARRPAASRTAAEKQLLLDFVATRERTGFFQIIEALSQQRRTLERRFVGEARNFRGRMGTDLRSIVVVLAGRDASEYIDHNAQRDDSCS